MTQGAKEGQMSAMQNLSSNEYPCLAVRRPRAIQGTYIRPTALFSWNSLIVVDGTNLLYNGAIIGTVADGQKQFATVNTKLCIFPDKKYIDLENNEFKSLEAFLTAQAGTVEFGTDYIEMDLEPYIGSGNAQYNYSALEPKVKVYSALDWDSETGWTKTGESEVDVSDVQVGNLIIPYKAEGTGAYLIATKTGEDEYTGINNEDGVYFEVTEANTNTEIDYKWEKWSCIVDGYYYYSTTGWISFATTEIPFEESYMGYTSYSFNSTTGKFVGGSTTMLIRWGTEGTIYRIYDNGREITKLTVYFSDGHWLISDASNSVIGPHYKTTYTKGTTNYGYVYGPLGSYPVNSKQLEGSTYYWYIYIGQDNTEFTTALGYDEKQIFEVSSFLDFFKIGDVVAISGCTSFPANNREGLQVESLTATRLTFTAPVLTLGSEAAAAAVSRLVPDFDFICSKDNRLWGIKDQTIHASALGDPTNFDQFPGLATDSYAVSVGSEGKFTGMIAYSGDLLCWKEKTLHKILGAYPAEYAMYTYDIEGLQDGSHKSMEIINEVLYYKGKAGIYAYSGGVPSLASYEIGLDTKYNAVAGTDGLKYYVSMQSGDLNWGLYVYDTLRGLWMKEDDIRVSDFAYLNNKLYFLDFYPMQVKYYSFDDWQIKAQIYDGITEEESVAWSAEFAPFTESVMNKKLYSKIFIRAELDDGAYFKVEISCDFAPYKTVHTAHSSRMRTVTVPVIPTRCDSFKIRLSGSGDCIIKSIMREYKAGSEL